MALVAEEICWGDCKDGRERVGADWAGETQPFSSLRLPLALVVLSRPGGAFIFGGAKLATVAGTMVFCKWVFFDESYLLKSKRKNMESVK